MNQTILKNMIAEWLEEFALPALIPRDAAPAPADLRNLSEILAIVGPRRAGKTFVMYQMIAGLMEEEFAGRDDILFLDFEDMGYLLSSSRPYMLWFWRPRPRMPLITFL